MPDPQATINDIARVLEPGGRLVIACRVGDDETPVWICVVVIKSHWPW